MRKDAELLQAWKDGDNAAGNELFDRHFDSLRRFFRNKVDITEVEDLMQRTLLACLEVVPKFRGEASFRTYLFVIARRQLVDYIRRKTRKENREAPDLGVSSIADFGITPSRAAFEQEVQALLAQAMQSIPVDFQITLRARQEGRPKLRVEVASDELSESVAEEAAIVVLDTTP